MKNVLKEVFFEMLNSPNPSSPLLLWKLNNAIEAILAEQFGTYSNPDVSVLAAKFNICIYNDSIIENFLSYHGHKNISIPVARYIKYQNSFDISPSTEEIHIDKNVPLSTRRYSIAYGIAEILLADDKIEYYNEYTIMELWNSSKKDLIKDSFALLLLFSVHSTVEILEEFYCSTCNLKITSEDWICFLAERTNSSRYYATKAYQIVRNLLGMADVINDKELIQLREKLINTLQISPIYD